MNSESHEKISVIVPIYNAEKHISVCIDSIIKQTYTNFEVLLVDDGSTDSSGRICDEYALINNCIRVFHKKNEGVSSARNFGIKNATGKWIAFVDADDQMLPNSLDILFENVQKGVDFIMAGYEVYNNEVFVRRAKVPDYTRLISVDECIRYLFTTKYSYQGYIWNKLFNADIIKFNNIFFDINIKFNEDRLFIVQYLLHIKGNCCFSEKVVYKYMLHKESAMSFKRKKTLNLNYLTDLDAFIVMLLLVKRRGNRLNQYFVQRGMFNSYVFNKRMILRNMGDAGQPIVKERKNQINDNIHILLQLWFTILWHKNRVKSVLKKCFQK